MPVNTPRKDYVSFTSKWKRLRDCHGGRDAVLASGKDYVPDLPGADKAANEAYRLRGNFYNAVNRTVFGMVGMLFQKDMLVKFPPRIADLLKDITFTSISMEMFSFTAAVETLLLGRYGVLVDMSKEAEVTTQRPYLVGYPAECIVSWSVERYGGDGQLTQVIVMEMYEEIDPKDEFVQIELCQYRVLKLSGGVYTQQLYRKNDKDEYVIFESEITPQRRGVSLDYIPFVFLGPLHVTEELVKPPLEDLADVNLGHWRNSCDYEQGLHLVSLPTPWAAGMKAKDSSTEEALAIGPSVVWELDVNGSCGMLEYQGAGMKEIAAAMEEKKKQMASLGARVLEQEGRHQETATAVAMRHGGEQATLRTLAIAIGQGLSMLLQMLAWWMDTATTEPKDMDVSVELNKDYLNVKATPQEIQTALAAVQAGKMSFETFWHLLQTGGWAREGITAEEELAQIAEEEPVMPTVAVDDVLNADGSITHSDGSMTMPDGSRRAAINQPPPEA